jgi:hypothetical protein
MSLNQLRTEPTEERFVDAFFVFTYLYNNFLVLSRKHVDYAKVRWSSLLRKIPSQIYES